MRKLPFVLQLTYALGSFGSSLLVNIIALQLVYFYRPPVLAGLPLYITQASFLVVFNAISIIAAFSRLFDAVTDPLIAGWSDRLDNKRGRRLPFMAWSALPAALFCWLTFVPPFGYESYGNVAWVAIMQFLFFLFLTMYVTPHQALLSELGKSTNERLNLATWLAISGIFGLLMAAQAPQLVQVLEGVGYETVHGWQIGFAILVVIALCAMYAPVLTIDERKYAQAQPSFQPIGDSIRATWDNPFFRHYAIADLTYFTGNSIMRTGLLYFFTVLLGLDETFIGSGLGLMLVFSCCCYPLVNFLGKRISHKKLIVFTFIAMSLILLGMSFLGYYPLDNLTQGYVVALLYGVPVSFLSILPNTVLANIASHDAMKTGRPKEGMFFAARTFLDKLGYTLGISIFAMLTTFGIDPGDDLGIRLSGVVGFFLCFAGGLLFMRYDEARLVRETAVLEQEALSASDQAVG